MPLPAAPAAIAIRRVDYADAADRTALLDLLDAYAQDPMGGGAPLPAATRAHLCDRLAAFAGAASWIAWASGAHAADQPSGPAHAPVAVGLLNSFLGFSTFKAQPLLNVHDIAVMPGWRGRGIAQQLLAAAEQHAQAQGCCKLTLEVLSGNAGALAAYRKYGFAVYALDPAAGEARFMQKWL